MLFKSTLFLLVALIASFAVSFAAAEPLGNATTKILADQQAAFEQVVSQTSQAIKAAVKYYEKPNVPAYNAEQVDFTLRMTVDITDVTDVKEYERFIANDIASALNISSYRVTASNLHADPLTDFPDAVYETSFLEQDSELDAEADAEAEADVEEDVEEPSLENTEDTIVNVTTKADDPSSPADVEEITEVVEETEVPFGRVLVDVRIIPAGPQAVPVRDLFSRFKGYAQVAGSPVYKTESLLDMDHEFDIVPRFSHYTPKPFVFKNDVDPATGLLRPGVRNEPVNMVPEWLVVQGGFSTPSYLVDDKPEHFYKQQ